MSREKQEQNRGIDIMVSETKPVDVALGSDNYRYGFSMPENYAFKSRKGIDETVVRGAMWCTLPPAS